MLSVSQIKSKLPLEFIENLYKIYNNRLADKILLGMAEKRYTTLRVNKLKYNIHELIKELDNLGIEYENVSWYNDALIIKNKQENDLQKLEIYNKGKIYLQSLSSMIPPLILNPKEGEKVLDLTSAPGSKTTQMACMMNNKGFILANELDKIRCEKLKYNIDMQGINIAKIRNGNGIEVGKIYPNTFDKVLLDTPCSGEGRFDLSDAKTYKYWSNKLIKDLVDLQKELFKSAVDALKINGEMCYSTCTLNKQENEEILNYAIKNLNVELIDIQFKIKDSIKGNTKGLDKTIEKALKITPNKNQEGFFVSKLRKKV